MRKTLIAAVALVVAGCGQAEVQWIETAQLTEVSAFDAAPLAEAPAHVFSLPEGERPPGATLNVWGFRIASPDGSVAEFRQTAGVELNLNMTAAAEGAPTTVGALVQPYAIENPIFGLYDVEAPAGWIPCGDGAVTHAVYLYHPFRDDLASAVLGFSGRPGETDSVYCGARAYVIREADRTAN